jgi:hypothetical protein
VTQAISWEGTQDLFLEVLAAEVGNVALTLKSRRALDLLT